MDAPKFCVHVVQQYVPALQKRIPSYGVSFGRSMKLVISVTDTAPVEVLPLLQAELTAKMVGVIPPSPQAAAQYAERLTHDYLTAQVLAGNLRFDKGASVWRWMGPREPSR